MNLQRYIHKHDVWLVAALAAVALALNACEPASKNKSDWDSINYLQIACSGENAKKPICHEKDHDADSIGKGRGKR